MDVGLEKVHSIQKRKMSVDKFYANRISET